MLGAQMAEQRVAEGKAGVVYQKIHIVTAHTTIEREIYRDARGVRQPRPRALHAEASQVRSLLQRSGCRLGQPTLCRLLSRLARSSARAASIGSPEEKGNLLTLETTVPQSRIEAESLTVRADDFHPVARTIRTERRHHSGRRTQLRCA